MSRDVRLLLSTELRLETLDRLDYHRTDYPMRTKTVLKDLTEMLENGIIEPSTSEWSS